MDELFEIQLDPGATPEPASPLVVAAGSGNGASADTLGLLFELGASPSGADGVHPLPYACGGLGWNYPPGGDADRVATLLAAGADPNSRRANGAPALAEAARGGDPGRVRLLLDAGADPVPDATIDVGGGMQAFMPFRDPLSMAAESGSALCVRLLLDAGARIDAHPEDDETPLARAGSLEALEALLEAGADAASTPGGRFSVAERVATNGLVPIEERVRMLRALGAAGADLNLSGPSATPLFSAALDGDDEAVEALLAAGADPHRRPTGLQGACFAAFVGPNPSMERVVDLLVAAGLDPNDADEAGLTPLHAALAPDQYGPDYAESDGFNEPAALALIRHGADISIRLAPAGYGALHAAAAVGSATVVAALLAAGADPRDRTPAGQTPLDVAKEHRHMDCVALLQRSGGA